MYLSKPTLLCGLTFNCVKSQMKYIPLSAGSPRSNAIGRMVESYEIACLTVFLASGKAHAITGEVIEASGGVGNAVNY